MVTMIIENEGVFYQPILEGHLQWTTERQGTPGSVKFNVVKDGVINFQEGNNLSIMIDGEPFFNGFVFSKKRTKKGVISVMAYDQLRYFKNKDTLRYVGKKASEVIAMLVEDFGFVLGDIADTKYVIPKRNEKNKTLFDIVGEALAITLQNTGEMFVLYDENGKLTLKNISDMSLDLLIDAETAEDLTYESSIDKDTYNKVELSRENKETGIPDEYVSQHGENINRWGVLQFVEDLKDGENGQAKADALLELYNAKTRKLSVKKAFGDIRVRAGSLIGVSLDLGDVVNNTMMLVEKCTHTLEKDVHTMDLILRGGEFNA